MRVSIEIINHIDDGPEDERPAQFGKPFLIEREGFFFFGQEECSGNHNKERNGTPCGRINPVSKIPVKPFRMKAVEESRAGMNQYDKYGGYGSRITYSVVWGVIM